MATFHDSADGTPQLATRQPPPDDRAAAEFELLFWELMLREIDLHDDEYARGRAN